MKWWESFSLESYWPTSVNWIAFCYIWSVGSQLTSLASMEKTEWGYKEKCLRSHLNEILRQDRENGNEFLDWNVGLCPILIWESDPDIGVGLRTVFWFIFSISTRPSLQSGCWVVRLRTGVKWVSKVTTLYTVSFSSSAHHTCPYYGEELDKISSPAHL